MKRALTGIQPSGEQHLGNWLGAISPGIALQESHETFYFIASYHALTTSKDPNILRERILDAAMTWLAFGLDPAKTAIWAQHDTPEVTEMTWLLSCVCSKGLLDKAHAFKDAVAKGKKQISAGLYTYPVLMASDILAFHSHVVPVGKDQKQHVEMARDMAQRFNHIYGETLTLPESLIQEDVAVIPGIDGNKMSKSYGNTIPLFLSPKKLRKRIMAVKTDSTPLEEPKDPDSCLVYRLFKLFATSDESQALAGKYRAGHFGYGHAKQALYEQINAHLAEPREKYFELQKRPDDVHDILASGATKARAIARSTLNDMREKMGL